MMVTLKLPVQAPVALTAVKVKWSGLHVELRSAVTVALDVNRLKCPVPLLHCRKKWSLPVQAPCTALLSHSPVGTL